MAPTPNLNILQTNMKLFAEKKIQGILEQGPPEGGAKSDLYELKGYLISKLMWNPNIDFEKTKNEFIDNFYGPAAPKVKEYIKVMYDNFDSLQRYHPNLLQGVRLSTFSKEYIANEQRILGEAKLLVANSDDKIKKRVELLQAQLNFVKLSVLRPSDEPDYKKIFDEFSTQVDDLNIFFYAESKYINQFLGEKNSKINQ
jgi:hypothetical protein